MFEIKEDWLDIFETQQFVYQPAGKWISRLIWSDRAAERGPKAEVFGAERLQTEVHEDPEDQGQTRETRLRPRVNFKSPISNIKLYPPFVRKFEYKYYVILNIMYLQNCIENWIPDNDVNLAILLSSFLLKNIC